MKFTYDWEFLEDGRTIEPISIGIVREDGEEYYAVVADTAWDRILRHKWLMDHVVMPFLPIALDAWGSWSWSFHEGLPSFEAVKSRAQIAYEVREFLTRDLSPGEDAELWAYFPAYDHVCLMQLWGPMAGKPVGLPMRTGCLMQHAVELTRRGVSFELPVQVPGTEHHALFDARHDMDMARAMGVI